MRPAAAQTVVVALLASVPALGALAGCGAAKPKPPASAGHAHGFIRVPGDAATITEAVSRAQPGDVVLVSPGVYHEAVAVRTPRVTLRGLDRNRVIIDGDVLRPNDVVLTGSGDAVQNITVRNATLNGILVTGEPDQAASPGTGEYSPASASPSPPLRGFVVDRVTSYDNGLYGVYAFDARDGMISNSYASGMADSGIYVGECKPCNIVVRANVAERNAVGFEGTNAGRQLFVYGNRFAGNRVGATLESNYQEALIPQDGAVIAGNVIAANGQSQTPEQAEGGFGIGVGIAGGTHNTVSKNLIAANPTVGLEITSAGNLPPVENQVVGNAFAANAVDVVYAATAAAPGTGNCLSGNRLTAVRPKSFPATCPGSTAPSVGVAAPVPRAPRGIPFTDVQAPPRLANMPDAAAAGPPVPGALGLPAITLPPSSLLAGQSTIHL
jgi:hypothetical protein